jgi:hypothetical protein
MGSVEFVIWIRGGRLLPKGARALRGGVFGVLGTARGVQTLRGGGGETSASRDRAFGPRCGLQTSLRRVSGLGLVMAASKDEDGLGTEALAFALLGRGDG